MQVRADESALCAEHLAHSSCDSHVAECRNGAVGCKAGVEVTQECHLLDRSGICRGTQGEGQCGGGTGDLQPS